MNQNTIRVGTVGFPVTMKMLFSRVDVVELAETYNGIPKNQTGKKRREETPAHVSYVVQLPKFLFTSPKEQTQLPGDRARYGEFQLTDENKKLLDKALGYADSVQADTLVLSTPSDFTPAKPRKEALRTFLDGVDLGNRKLVWQPSGPWEVEKAAAFAAEIGAVLAVDPLRDPPTPGPSCYLRLGPFSAMGSRVGNYDLEQIAKIAQSFADATVVFDTDRAFDDAKNLKTVLLEGRFEDDDEEDDDDDDDGDFDDEIDDEDEE